MTLKLGPDLHPRCFDSPAVRPAAVDRADSGVAKGHPQMAQMFTDETVLYLRSSASSADGLCSFASPID
jgi:hypothetical protein